MLSSQGEDAFVSASGLTRSPRPPNLDRIVELNRGQFVGAPQPIAEDALLTGPLEPTNQWYAVAKIAAIKLCDAYRRQHACDFISAMPTNLYGPFDNFDLSSSHVVPALVRKFHDAKLAGRDEVVVWGTGSPRREFLHVDDLADACVFLMNHYEGPQHINVGTGEDLSIRELAEMVRGVVHPSSNIVFDSTKPDGTPRKLLDVGRLHDDVRRGRAARDEVRDPRPEMAEQVAGLVR